MKLLVLGGGGFLGFHMAAEAASAGHTVTTFNRDGKSELEGVEALAGDRRGDLAALRGRSWDAVVDTFSDPRGRRPNRRTALRVGRRVRVRVGHQRLPPGRPRRCG